MEFDKKDDNFYQRLISRGSLAPSNRLRGCLPSQVDLMKDCFATWDLGNATLLEASNLHRYQQVAVGLESAVPQQYRNVSLLEYNEYWSVLTQIPGVENRTRDAAVYCAKQGIMTVPLASVNFTASCLQTAIYYWRTLPSNRGIFNGLAGLMRVSLPQSYSKYSDSTLFETGVSLLQHPENFTSLEHAAERCYLPYCRNLGFAGNADIAGKGALIVYLLMAIFATIFWTIARLAQHDLIRRTGNVRKALITSALSFWDAITFLGLMTIIASLSYIISKAESVYEDILCIFVALLASNASITVTALVGVSVGDEKPESDWFRLIPTYLSMALQETVCVSFLSSKSHGRLSEVGIVDFACYRLEDWPITLATIAAWIGIIEGAVVLICMGSPFFGLFGSSFAQKLKSWFAFRTSDTPSDHGPVMKVVEVVACVAMWMNTIFLVRVRDHAKYLYGKSFEDNAFGFGQIMAAGFCVEIGLVFTFEISGIIYTRRRRQQSSLGTTGANNSHELQPQRPPIRQDHSSTAIPLLSGESMRPTDTEEHQAVTSGIATDDQATSNTAVKRASVSNAV